MLTSFSSLAQTGTFRKQYHLSNYDAASVHVLPDSSYVLLGNSYPGPIEHAAIIKLSPAGQVQWTKTYSQGTAAGVGISGGIPLSGGGYLLGQWGSFGTSPGNSNRFIRTDASGNLLYVREHKFAANSSDLLAAQIQTTDGYIINVGATYDSSMQSSAFHITKLDTAGNLIWDLAVETNANSSKESALNVIECSDGNYVVCGRSVNSLNGSFDCYVVKVSPSGTVIWNKFYGTANYDAAYGVAELSDGSLVFTALSDSLGQSLLLFFKTDTGGNLAWCKSYTSLPLVIGVQLKRRSGDRLISTGYAVSSTQAPFLLALDSAGNVQWCRYYFMNGNGVSTSVQLTPDNGFVLAGTLTDTLTFHDDIFLIKTDSVGKSDCLGTPVTCTAAPFALTELSFGYSLTGGYLQPNVTSVVSSSVVTTVLCVDETGMQDRQEENNLVVFPNPVSDQLSISAKNTLRETTLQLFDALGREALRKNTGDLAAGETLTLPVDLPPGIYQLLIRHADGMEKKKLIIR